jgi:hypothetical protein
VGAGAAAKAVMAVKVVKATNGKVHDNVQPSAEHHQANTSYTHNTCGLEGMPPVPSCSQR